MLFAIMGRHGEMETAPPLITEDKICQRVIRTSLTAQAVRTPLHINTIKLRKRYEQNVNFAEKHLTKRRKSEVSLPVAMKPIEIGV